MSELENKKLLERLDSLITRLDVVINLLFKTAEKMPKKGGMRERISTLHSFGVRPTEIAKIVGRTESYINKEISLMKKTKSKKRLKV